MPVEVAVQSAARDGIVGPLPPVVEQEVAALLAAVGPNTFRGEQFE